MVQKRLWRARGFLDGRREAEFLLRDDGKEQVGMRGRPASPQQEEDAGERKRRSLCAGPMPDPWEPQTGDGKKEQTAGRMQMRSAERLLSGPETPRPIAILTYRNTVIHLLINAQPSITLVAPFTMSPHTRKQSYTQWGRS